QMMAAVLDQQGRDLEIVQSAIAEAARAKAGASMNPGAPTTSSYSQTPPARVSPSPIPTSRPSRPPETPEELQARRDTLARKLGAAARKSSSPPSWGGKPHVTPETARMAGEALKARYEAALVEAKKLQLARYLELGKSALERKDFAAAANAYQIAAS